MINELDSWTCKMLNKTNKINKKSDNSFWYIIRNLNQLEYLNKITFVSTAIKRIYNRKDCISYKYALNDFNYTTKKNEKLHDFNCLPPTQAVVNNLDYILINKDSNKHIIDFNELNIDNYKHLKYTINQLNKQKMKN